MRNAVPTAALLVLATALAGCGSSGGLNRDRPDEFAVARQAPLVIPPDYALTPPTPGAPRPQDTAASTQALQAIFGGAAPRSAIESSTLQQAGGNTASAGVRSDVGDPDTAVVDKGTVTRDVITAPEGDGQEARANAGAPTTGATTVPSPDTP